MQVQEYGSFKKNAAAGVPYVMQTSSFKSHVDFANVSGWDKAVFTPHEYPNILRSLQEKKYNKDFSSLSFLRTQNNTHTHTWFIHR